MWGVEMGSWRDMGETKLSRLLGSGNTNPESGPGHIIIFFRRHHYCSRAIAIIIRSQLPIMALPLPSDWWNNSVHQENGRGMDYYFGRISTEHQTFHERILRGSTVLSVQRIFSKTSCRSRVYYGTPWPIRSQSTRSNFGNAPFQGTHKDPSRA
jgi:hypothetical protein